MENMEKHLKVLKGVLLLRRFNRAESKEKQIARIEKCCTEKEIDEWIEALKNPAPESEIYYEDEPYIVPYEDKSEKDYSPSCPWNAPGMSIHDFI